MEAFAALDAQQGSALAVRLLTYVGVFRSMADETASIALRGLDPATFARLDAVCLVADGELRDAVWANAGVATGRGTLNSCPGSGPVAAR